MKETPVRIQRSRQKKQVSPNGLPIVYVGRPSKWGNPFPCAGVNHLAVESYMDWIYRRKEMYVGRTAPSIEEIRNGLRGKNLSCWCRPGEPCHGDVLLEIANS